MSPLIPRPAITLIAITLTAGMLGNIWLDAKSVDYSGGQTTLILATLIGGILGIPIGVAAFRKTEREVDDKAGDPR